MGHACGRCMQSAYMGARRLSHAGYQSRDDSRWLHLLSITPPGVRGRAAPPQPRGADVLGVEAPALLHGRKRCTSVVRSVLMSGLLSICGTHACHSGWQVSDGVLADRPLVKLGVCVECSPLVLCVVWKIWLRFRISGHGFRFSLRSENSWGKWRN